MGQRPEELRDVICVRLGNLRGLDLRIFDFDHDLSWQALFVTARGQVLGRFGGRDAKTPAKYHSLPALKYALQDAKRRFDAGDLPPVPAGNPDRPEEYPASRKLPENSCFHCHHVPEFRRAAQRSAGTWHKDLAWVYPEPGNIGLELDLEQSNRLLSGRGELRAGDVLRRIGATPIASSADVQNALHRAPLQGVLELIYERDGKMKQTRLELAAGWKATDLTWRWSLKHLAPAPQVHGYDLTAAEKAKLGLPPRALAFYQGNFMTKTARQAGLQIGDVILGIDAHQLEMTVEEFDLFVRINYAPGAEVAYRIRRGDQPLKIALKLGE